VDTDKFVQRAQKFVGSKGTVDRTVVVQQRPISAVLAGAAAFFAVAIFLSLISLNNILLVGVLGGAALGGVMASRTKNFYLAGVENKVQVIRLSKWGGQPETLVKTLRRPLEVTPSKGLVSKAIILDGEKYVVSKLFAAELEALTEPI